MALSAEKRFQVRYYLGYPDLPSLPPITTDIEEEITLLQKSSELEVRMTNLSTYAEEQVLSLLTKLDAGLIEMDLGMGRFPFKRIEDITFRDNEIDLRWDANNSLVTQLANLLGMTAYKSLGNSWVGLEAV